MHDYEGPDEKYLTIYEDEIVDVIEQGEVWWKGRLRGDTGYFPISYCRPMRMVNIDTSSQAVSSYIRLMQKRCGLLSREQAAVLKLRKVPISSKISNLTGQLNSQRGFPRPAAIKYTTLKLKQLEEEELEDEEKKKIEKEKEEKR